MIKTVYSAVVCTLTIVLFFPIFAFGWLFCRLFRRYNSSFYKFSRAYGRVMIFSLPGWRIKISGLENLDKTKTYLVMSNHQSMFDIPLLATIDNNMLWVAKHEVMNMPLVNLVVKMRGDILIRRGALADSKRMVKSCRKLIREGVSVVIFPEGTRTKSGRVGEFKEGAFVVAKLSGADILPIVVDGVFDATHPVGRGGLSFPATLTAHILTSIPHESIKNMQVDELRDTVRKTMVNYHKSIRPELYTE